MLGWIPARGQWQRRSEGSTSNAEEEAEDQHFSVGMDTHLPSVSHCCDDDDLTDDGRFFR
jgi:hypothetical protein